jgi:hypothetical protein
MLKVGIKIVIAMSVAMINGRNFVSELKIF